MLTAVACVCMEYPALVGTDTLDTCSSGQKFLPVHSLSSAFLAAFYFSLLLDGPCLNAPRPSVSLLVTGHLWPNLISGLTKRRSTKLSAVVMHEATVASYGKPSML